MNPIEELKTEHRAVEEALRILEGICRRSEAERRIAAPDAERVLEFLAVFVDTCHHGKEEELLFPALEREGVPRDGGPIGVMLAEHDAGRAHIAGMRRALAQAAPAEFVQHARAYADLLRQHIFKEDNVLFRIAAQRLSPELEAELREGFDRIEAEKVGPGRHEAFHRMLDELGRSYPG